MPTTAHSRPILTSLPLPRGAMLLVGLSVSLFAMLCETPMALGAEVAKSIDVPADQLVTSDGVQLRATYFPGKDDEDTVPVILLHSWKADRREYIHLAPYLQAKGYAVLVPDLRGHGQSTRQTIGYGPRQKTKELDPAKFRGPEFAAMANFDMAVLRKFLLKKNNEKELNLNKLVVVGSELGASVAIAWAVHDWSIPNYLHAGIKQGQDVKGLVLLSPKWSQAGLPASLAMNGPIVGARLQLLIAVGTQDSKNYRDARQFESKLRNNRPDTKDVPLVDSSFWYFPLNTDLSGAKILTQPSLKLHEHIAGFIELRIIKAEGSDAPWMEHKGGQ